MSAACAPATATKPAAVPRRRLFTIFISTSIVILGGIGLRRALLTLEGPLTLPSPYRPFRCHRCPLGTGLTGRSDLGMPPSVARPPYLSCSRWQRLRDILNSPKRCFQSGVAQTSLESPPTPARRTPCLPAPTPHLGYS